jgi:hypothetical protein
MDGLIFFKKSGNNMVAITKEGKLKFAKLDKGYRVKGVICSNDFDPRAEKRKVHHIECDTKMNGNSVFDA